MVIPFRIIAASTIPADVSWRWRGRRQTVGTISSGARTLTTEALLLRAAKAAAGFESLGVAPFDTVALYLRNDIAYLEASFGVSRLGAYPVAVNWHYPDDQARYLVE